MRSTTRLNTTKLKDNISDASDTTPRASVLPRRVRLCSRRSALLSRVRRPVKHIPTSGHRGSTLTSVAMEHRERRFLYEVPPTTGPTTTSGLHLTRIRSLKSSKQSRRNSYTANSHRGPPSSSSSSVHWSATRGRRSSHNLLTEYTLNSTIHGVKYLGGPDRPWPERVWWMIMFVISICVCTALIMNTYNKWTSDPVIVTFSQMATPVWRIPFPAVTICPTNIVRQSQFNFTDILTKVQDKDVKLNLTATE